MSDVTDALDRITKILETKATSAEEKVVIQAIITLALCHFNVLQSIDNYLHEIMLDARSK